MKPNVQRIPGRRAFSLLELMTVVLLISILVTIGIVRIADSSDKAKVKICNSNRIQLNSALERFAVSNGSFAASMTDISTSDYFPGGIPVCPVDGSAYTLNTTTHRVDGHAH